jgi:hypothetical protein
MGGACSSRGENETENVKCLGDPRVNGKILKKQAVRQWSGLIRLRLRSDDGILWTLMEHIEQMTGRAPQSRNLRPTIPLLMAIIMCCSYNEKNHERPEWRRRYRCLHGCNFIRIHCVTKVVPARLNIPPRMSSTVNVLENLKLLVLRKSQGKQSNMAWNFPGT